GNFVGNFIEPKLTLMDQQGDKVFDKVSDKGLNGDTEVNPSCRSSAVAGRAHRWPATASDPPQTRPPNRCVLADPPTFVARASCVCLRLGSHTCDAGFAHSDRGKFVRDRSGKHAPPLPSARASKGGRRRLPVKGGR